jgi:Domain of unknown function (DUF3850)
MTTHDIKSWPEFYGPVAAGKKSFELRIDDRKYQVGDVLHLREYDDRKGEYTGQSVKKLVTYKLDGIGQGAIAPYHGLIRGYCILSLADLPQ